MTGCQQSSPTAQKEHRNSWGQTGTTGCRQSSPKAQKEHRNSRHDWMPTPTTQKEHRNFRHDWMPTEQPISSEGAQKLQAHLQQERQRHSQQRDMTSDVPLFEQPAVHSKMLNFHSKLASLQFHNCIICLECFPNLILSANSTLCAHCNWDNRIPNLYLAAGPWTSPTTTTNEAPLVQNPLRRLLIADYYNQ